MLVVDMALFASRAIVQLGAARVAWRALSEGCLQLTKAVARASNQPRVWVAQKRAGLGWPRVETPSEGELVPLRPPLELSTDDERGTEATESLAQLCAAALHHRVSVEE